MHRMEVSAAAIASFGWLCAVIIWAWKVLNWVWLRPKRLERCLRQQGLSGNPYRLFHGDLKDMSAMTRDAMSRPINLSNDITLRVVPFQRHLISKYGKNYYMWMGPTPVVNIVDPKLIWEVLHNYEVFQKPRRNPLLKLLINGVINFEGDQWHARRKILNPAFHLDKLKDMLPAFQLSSEEMLKNWETLTTESGSAELDVWPYLEILTAEVISRTAFGSSYEEGRKIFQLQDEQIRIYVSAMQSTYIPGSRFLPTKTNKRMKQIFNEVRAMVRDVVTRREKAMKAGEAKNDDLLGIMMESNLKETREHGKKEMWMSIDDVIEECRLFFSAGQETTTTLLVWTIVLLGQHTSWQDLARSEVLQVFGTNRPDSNGLSRLKVVSMILNEALRLYPPAIETQRLVTKETKLGELTLPVGAYVLLPMILLHRDHDIWGNDAQEFNPQRFSEGVFGATKNQPAAFFPFILGPRTCIGQNFTLIEAKVALSMILQRFRFELSPSYAHAPYSKITLQPQFGAHIILHKM